MRKLVQVEDAKSLLEVAKDWGVWRWLTEKKRVRQTADTAWEAFDELEKDVKSGWSDDLQKAYAELAAEAAVADGGAPAKRKSASMAREASQVAIDAYSLREKAVRKAETAARAK